MPTKAALDESERRELLGAIHETYDAREMSDDDRDYFKRLAVAKLIRERRLDEAEPAPVDPTKPKVKPPVVDGLPGVDDEPTATSGPEPLPSLDGM